MRTEIKVGVVEIFALPDKEMERIRARITCFIDPHFFDSLNIEGQALFMAIVAGSIRDYLTPEGAGLRAVEVVGRDELEQLHQENETLRSQARRARKLLWDSIPVPLDELREIFPEKGADHD